MLNVIINNTHPFKGNILPQKREMPLSSDSFICDFQEFSPNLHAFRVKDCTHELDCELILEVKKSFVFLEESGETSPPLAPVVTCTFPTINLQRFNEKTGFDAYFQRLVTAQFHLNILEQLLLFCEQKDATNLALTINHDSLGYIEIYSRFFVSVRQVTTEKEEQTEAIIPTDTNTYDRVVDFIDKIDREFRCALWRQQRYNSDIREYLKLNS